MATGGRSPRHPAAAEFVNRASHSLVACQTGFHMSNGFPGKHFSRAVEENTGDAESARLSYWAFELMRFSARKPAKHESMKRKPTAHPPQPGGPVNGSALTRATLLYRRLRSGLDSVARRPFTYNELAKLTGEPKSTLCNWNNGDGQPAPETLLRLLEMLPTLERNQILSELPFSRVFPVFEHPKLAYDPSAVSLLKTVLRSETGITLVQGDRDNLITFLATAMGHSYLMPRGRKGQVLGIDVHAPDWFVPLPEVTYLNNALNPGRVREVAEKIWPTLITSHRHLIVLNGTWTHVPDLRLATCTLAETHHVIVTDLTRQKLPAPSLPHPARIVTVLQDGKESERIRVDVQFV